MKRSVGLCCWASAHHVRRATVSLLITILACLPPVAATGEVFSDDFNRSDGPLGDPWITMNDDPNITSQRVVSNANEFGSMYRWSSFAATEVAIEFDLCFNGDDDDGRFHIYVGGGMDVPTAWLFSGRVTPTELILRRLPPAEDLVTTYSFPNPLSVRHLRLEYDEASTLLSLILVDDQTSLFARIDTPASAPGPFTWCAIGAENEDDSAKWIDDAFYFSNGRPTGVVDFGFEMSGLGLVNGHTGYYMDYLASGGFVESSLYYEENGYLRMHAYTQTEGGGYVSYPAGCYLTRLDVMAVGDSWQSYMDGYADADVAALETVHTPAGTFDAFRVEYRRQGSGELLHVIWYAPDVGFVRLGPSPDDHQDLYDFGLNGGAGFLPLAVGNWWAVEEVTDLDFGDAPSIPNNPLYPTLLAQDGARHLIVGSWLGDVSDAPDAETDGQPHDYARGDDEDIDGAVYDDEDGVIMPPFNPGETTSITVTVGGSGGALEAWVDFDQDFVWDHPGEQIHAGWLDAGQHVLAVTVPEDAPTGNTFARFRISSAGGLLPTGAAADGEVEDHEVTVVPVLIGKWEQFPDLSEHAMAVRQNWRLTADDFVCTETGPLTEFGLWVAIRSDELPPPGFDTEDLYWRLRIYGSTTNPHTDQLVPERPLDFLWQWEGSNDAIDTQEWAAGVDGFFYDPDAAEPTFWSKAYYVRIRIPQAEAFVQTGTPEDPVVYWLHSWSRFNGDWYDSMPGWLVSPDHWNNPAVFYSSGSVQNWIPLPYPPESGLGGQRIDFAFALNPKLDYGDAPGTEAQPGYPTLFSQNGAGHFVTGPWLGDAGSAPDADPDGQPDADARGDDQDGGDDEGGVQFASMIPGAVTSIEVQVGGEAGFVQGWIDWDQDNSWGPTEIVVNTQLALGNHQFYVTVPDTALVGASYARFRISRDGNLQPHGCAKDGEIEDHRVTIGEPSGLPGSDSLPDRYRLHSCAPNPFNPRTTIGFDLPRASVVNLRVYDLAGRLVRTLIDGDVVEAGRREAVWQGRDEAGRQVAAGVYWCRIEAGGYNETRRMVLIK